VDVLAAKRATYLGGDDANLRFGQPEGFGNLGPRVPGALRGGVQGQGAVGAPFRCGGVRLQVALVHGGGAEFALHHNIRLPQARGGIPLSVLEGTGHVAGLIARLLVHFRDHTFVQQRRPWPRGRQHIHHRRQHLIVHLDQPARFLGNVG